MELIRFDLKNSIIVGNVIENTKTDGSRPVLVQCMRVRTVRVRVQVLSGQAPVLLNTATAAEALDLGPPKHRIELGLGSVWVTVSYLLQEVFPCVPVKKYYRRLMNRSFICDTGVIYCVILVNLAIKAVEGGRS